MSGGNETDYSTQVLAVRCTWAPVTMSYHAGINFLRSRLPWCLPSTESPQEQLPGVCQAGGMRTYYEKIGDEILAVRYYREGEKRSIQIIPGSSYF
jgi:hypothetical protein